MRKSICILFPEIKSRVKLSSVYYIIITYNYKYDNNKLYFKIVVYTLQYTIVNRQKLKSDV